MVRDVDDPAVVLDDDAEDAQGEGIADEAQLFNLLYKSDDDRMVKRTPKEEALQAAARSLIFEYGFDLADLERAFPVKLTTVSQATGKVKTRTVKLDIAAFASGAAHTRNTIVRAGFIAAPGTKHDEQAKGVDALDQILGALLCCEFGFWTNGTELAFRRKIMQGSAPTYVDIGDTPAAGETLTSLANQKGRRLVAVTSETLAQAFRRCHDYIISCLRAGADDYISLPAEPEQILDVLRRVLAAPTVT